MSVSLRAAAVYMPQRDQKMRLSAIHLQGRKNEDYDQGPGLVVRSRHIGVRRYRRVCRRNIDPDEILISPNPVCLSHSIFSAAESRRRKTTSAQLMFDLKGETAKRCNAQHY